MAEFLIIDDDPKICRLLAKLTTDIQHEASVANTLKDGLDKVTAIWPAGNQGLPNPGRMDCFKNTICRDLKR